MEPTEVRAALKKVNTELDRLTFNRYHSTIPLTAIDHIVTIAGFDSPNGWSHPIGGREGRSSVQLNDKPAVFLHVNWYQMGSGNYEVVAYANTDEDLPLPAMSPADKKKAVKRANDVLADLGKKYHNSIPLQAISDILEVNGFDPSKVGNGIFVGASGRAHEPVGFGVYLTMTWYKMESGQYEIVAYLS
jgi:hypothetical protein